MSVFDDSKLSNSINDSSLDDHSVTVRKAANETTADVNLDIDAAETDDNDSCDATVCRKTIDLKSGIDEESNVASYECDNLCQITKTEKKYLNLGNIGQDIDTSDCCSDTSSDKVKEKCHLDLDTVSHDIDISGCCSSFIASSSTEETVDLKLGAIERERDDWLTTFAASFKLLKERRFCTLSVLCNEFHFELFRFYKELRNELIQNFNLQEDAIKHAIDNLNYNYRNVFKGKTPSEIDFNDMNHCVAYLHIFAACHAALVQEEVSKVLRTSPDVLGKLSSKHRLNVVCLGSGPGNDLVGLLCALQDHLKMVNILDITVVDKMSGWAHVFGITVQKLQEGVHKKVGLWFKEIASSFIKADLTNTFTWSKGMTYKLKNTDIILLVKVLSNVPDANKLQALKNVVDLMKPGALLFFIDCPLPPEALFDMNPTLQILYQTEVREFDFDCKEESFRHYNITLCRAAVYVLGLRNPNEKEHVPDLDDVTEWPKLQ